jgi:hypothetical protein
VERLVEGDDHVLAAPAAFTPWARHSLMAHSTVSEPVVSRNTFFSGSGSRSEKLLHQPRADFAGEAIVGEQAGGACAAIGVGDLLAAVAGVGDQHAGGPVDPLVAPGVVHLEALGAMPDDGRLPAHGHGGAPAWE